MSKQIHRPKTVPVRISPELHKELKIKAAKENKTIKSLIEESFDFAK